MSCNSPHLRPDPEQEAQRPGEPHPRCAVAPQAFDRGHGEGLGTSPAEVATMASRAIQMSCLGGHSGEPEESSGKQTLEFPWVGGCTWEDQIEKTGAPPHREWGRSAALAWGGCAGIAGGGGNICQVANVRVSQLQTLGAPLGKAEGSPQAAHHAEDRCPGASARQRPGQSPHSSTARAVEAGREGAMGGKHHPC